MYGVLSAYSVPLLGFLPVLIEYQPYFLLPVAFYVLLGIIWGAVAGMRARMQELVSRAARSHHYHQLPHHDDPTHNDFGFGHPFSTPSSSTASTPMRAEESSSPSAGAAPALSGFGLVADAAAACGLTGDAAVVALAMLVGPVLGGLTLDVDGTYRNACFWSAALLLVGSVLLCCVRTPRARRRNSVE